MRIELRKKVKTVQQYLRGERRAAELAELLGVNREAIYRWARKYEKDGAAGLENKAGVRYIEKNPTYLPELKLAAVREYIAGNGSQETICKKYGIRSRHALQSWVKVYNTHGDFNSVKHSGGGSYMKQGRDTTQEERIQIAKDCIASGKNYGEMALKYTVSYQQARTWTLRYEELGEAGLDDRRGRRKKDQIPRTELEKAQIEIEQLKHKLYLSEMENALLKKLNEIERRDASRK